ncbi:MAG: AraC family transcriptional regulator [Maribacter sp.]|uniref:helix-turn-helix domain-containing protein n=1 Tax=Maribacter sp. TaxID=1897614 RepID=UPI00329958D3
MLLIFPFVYFSLYGLLKRAPITLAKHWWHFVLPGGYFLTQIPFYLAPLAVKYNAYLGAYFPELPTLEVTESFNYSYHIIKDIFDWLILLSISFYTLVSLKLVRDERSKNVSNKIKGKSGKYRFSRNSAVVLLLLLVFIFIIFYSYDDDGGDHYIVFFQTIIAFSTTYLIMSESRFFEKSWIADKYETLGNSKRDIEFAEIQNYVERENYFLSQEASLHDLASLLQAHPNQISKIINLQNESNFNDYINQKRVKLATTRLTDTAFSHLTIEAIGTSVGFKSKSAFYNAFKKHTGTSPSAFTKQVSPKL